MSFWGNIMTRTIAGYAAFTDPAILSDPYDFDGEWGDWKNRKLRYNINWNYYQNTAYDAANKWSRSYKTKKGLYRYIRNIYNPSYRLGEFWKTHIFGGEPLFFEAENEELSKALAQIYRWSNWEINKDLLSLYGAVMGDVGLRVRDDPARGKVYFEVINPAAIKSKTLDPQGNVKGYIIEENRTNPNKPGATVTYTEIAWRDGEDVMIETQLNGKPFPWDGEEATYSIEYGFVPMVFIQHNDVGLNWGWSEIHPGLSKFREVDDSASKSFDYIRKMTDPKWLFIGIEKPKLTPDFSKTMPTSATLSENPFPGREEENVIYVKNENAKAQAMVANLDLNSSLAHIKELLTEIERDYPELQMDIWSGGGDTSGRALRIARQRVTSKVKQRRIGYYDALVRANMMALAIGGMRGYFPGFDLDSFEQGDLDHAIKPREVFALDPVDVAELDKIQAETIKVEQEALRWPTVFVWRKYLEADGLTEDEAQAVIDRALQDAQQEDDFGFKEASAEV